MEQILKLLKSMWSYYGQCRTFQTSPFNSACRIHGYSGDFDRSGGVRPADRLIETVKLCRKYEYLGPQIEPPCSHSKILRRHMPRAGNLRPFIKRMRCALEKPIRGYLRGPAEAPERPSRGS